MNQTGARLQAEINAVLSTTDVDVLDIRSFGEVLHIGSTVKDGIYLQTSIERLRHVTKNDMQALAKEFFERTGEVIV